MNRSLMNMLRRGLTTGARSGKKALMPPVKEPMWKENFWREWKKLSPMGQLGVVGGVMASGVAFGNSFLDFLKAIESTEQPNETSESAEVRATYRGLTNLKDNPHFCGHFVHRSVQAADLKAAAEFDDVNYVLVTGAPGTGKTFLLNEWADNQAKNEDVIVWQFNASSKESFEMDLHNLAEALGSPLKPGMTFEDMAYSIANLITDKECKKCFFLIDKVHEVPLTDEQGSGQALLFQQIRFEFTDVLQRYLKDVPAIQKIGFVIASQDQNLNAQINGLAVQSKIDLNDGLTVAEAVQVIGLCQGRQQETQAVAGEAEKLAECLHRYPMACAQAATFIKFTDISVGEFVSQYNKFYTAMFVDQQRLFRNNKLWENCYFVLITLIIDKLNENRELKVAKDFLLSSVFLGNISISRTLVQQWANFFLAKQDGSETTPDYEAGVIVGELRTTSFLSWSVPYTLHPIVRDVARVCLENEAVNAWSAYGRFDALVEQKKKMSWTAPFGMFDEEKVRKTIEENPPKEFDNENGTKRDFVWRYKQRYLDLMLQALVGEMESAGKFPTAPSMSQHRQIHIHLRSVLQYYERELRSEDMRNEIYARALFHLGTLEGVIDNNFSLATGVLNESLRLQRSCTSTSKNSLVEIMNMLAYFRLASKDIKGAEATLQEALTINPNNNDDKGITLMRLGLVRAASNQHEDAIKYFEQSKVVFESLKISLTGREWRHVLAGVNAAQAISLNSLGRKEEAQLQLQGALSNKIAVYGERHPSVADVLMKLADVCIDRDSKTQYLNQALSIRREAYGAQHPKTVEVKKLLSDSEVLDRTNTNVNDASKELRKFNGAGRWTRLFLEKSSLQGGENGRDGSCARAEGPGK